MLNNYKMSQAISRTDHFTYTKQYKIEKSAQEERE